MKTWRAWTQKELHRLEQLRLDGLTAKAIALILERTLSSVRDKLQEEGLAYLGRRLDWISVLSGPHTISGAARIMGTQKHAVKQQKRKLRRAGFDIPAADLR